jgi:hypothetical protein
MRQDRLSVKNGAFQKRGVPLSPGGLPGWTDADFLYFLENGQRRTGEVPKPPMKRYKLSQEDALAILAYLRSLTTPGAENEHRRTDAVLPLQREH